MKLATGTFIIYNIKRKTRAAVLNDNDREPVVASLGQVLHPEAGEEERLCLALKDSPLTLIQISG
jgi:hypothetical protein